MGFNWSWLLRTWTQTGVIISLQTLPKGISALRSLRVLDLEGNRLEYLATEISEPALASYTSIAVFQELRYSIYPAGYLRELQKLNVQSNRITNLPRGLG